MNQPTNGILEEFRLEFLDCWQRLPNKAFFFVLLAAWLLLFQFLGSSTLGYVKSPSLYSWMYNAYTEGGKSFAESDNSFGALVPFAVLLLLWLKRRELMSVPLAAWSPGLLLLSVALVLHVLGYAVQQPRLSVLGLYTGIYGLAGLAWGGRWLRASFFPCFLLVFCVPLGQLTAPISFYLQSLVCRLVEAICHFLLAIDVVREGHLLKDPTGRYQYEVAAACSGIRSLIATVALATILAFWSFRMWWKRLVMFASALPLAVLGNLLRMLGIVIAAEIGGQEAGQYVHDGGPMGIFSLVNYVVTFVGLLVLEHYLRGRPAPRTTGTLELKQV